MFYLRHYHAKNLRQGTPREVFHQADMAKEYMDFIENVAKDLGVRGMLEIVVAEIYDQQQLHFLQQPQRMVNFVYRSMLRKLSPSGREAFSRVVNEHLEAAARETGLDIPQR